MRLVLRRPGALRQRRTRDERGVVAVMMAGCVVVLVLIAAFAVDLGMQRVARRDMQTLADSVALDVSRLLDGRTTSEVKSGSVVRARLDDTLDRSVARNLGTSLGEPTSGCTTSIPGGTASTVASSCVKAFLVELTATGTYPTFNGFPVEAPSGTIPTGVVVLANTRVAFAFSGMTGLTGGAASRTAVAATVPRACFRIGSFGARINSGNSGLLAGLINAAGGGFLDVSALSYQGLAGANVNLLQLATALGLGSPDQLASADVTVQQVAIAAATVLSQNGDTANAAVLNTIATQLSGTGTFSLGNVLDVSQGGAAAASAGINALDLIAGSIFVANGTSAIAIPGLATTLGLTGSSLKTTLSLIERPKMYCGAVGTEGPTSQATVTVTGQLANLATPTPVAGFTDFKVNASGTNVTGTLAGADGVLTKIQCGDATTTATAEGVDVDVTSRLASVKLEQTLTFSGTTADTGLLGSLLGGLLGGILKLEVSGSATVTASPLAQDLTKKTASIRIPPRTYDTPVSTGSGDLGLRLQTATGSTLTLKATGLLGLNINLSADQRRTIIDSLVAAAINPLVNSLNTSLITPLSDLLGMQLGGADVFAVPRPNCTAPSLVG